MTMISNKNRLKTGNVSVLNRASAGIGIAGLSGIAAAQSASAQTNFQSLPGADYLIDQATGADDVLIDLGNISITSMADDGAGVFTFA